MVAGASVNQNGNTPYLLKTKTNRKGMIYIVNASGQLEAGSTDDTALVIRFRMAKELSRK